MCTPRYSKRGACIHTLTASLEVEILDGLERPPVSPVEPACLDHVKSTRYYLQHSTRGKQPQHHGGRTTQL